MVIQSFIKRIVSEKFSAVEPSTAVDINVRKSLPNDADFEGFIPLTHEGDLANGRGRTFAAPRTAMALFHANGNYVDLTTGDCMSFPGRPVGFLATKMADGFVWVGMRSREGTHHRGGDHVDGLTTAEHAS